MVDVNLHDIQEAEMLESEGVISSDELENMKRNDEILRSRLHNSERHLKQKYSTEELNHLHTISETRREQKQEGVPTEYYTRTVEASKSDFLLDDNLMHDLLERKSRELNFDADTTTVGFASENYPGFDIEPENIDRGLKYRYSESFGPAEITDFMDKALQNGRQLYFAEGLDERLKNNFYDEIVDEFMDVFSQVAEPVTAEPDDRSAYPVDSGIAQAASDRNADIVAYDRDFLDETDVISCKNAKAYTPHQARVLME